MKLGSPEETDIDIRVISSTNELPMEAIANGHLREDLFYRLAVMQVSIPSLCERLEDIPELIQSFIESNNQRFGKNIKGVAPEVMEQFLTYSWPGNVRQLKTCIESAMHLAKDNTYIHISDLPPYVLEMITASKPLDASLAASAPLKESDMKESPETADSPDAAMKIPLPALFPLLLFFLIMQWRLPVESGLTRLWKQAISRLVSIKFLF